MEPKKSLKKLSINKEEVVNLNDQNMEQLQGGSTFICVTVSATVSIVYDVTKSNFWTCPTPDQPSKVWIDMPNGKSCLIDEVVVIGWDTTNPNNNN